MNKTEVEVPLPVKLLVITQLSPDGLEARFIFQPVGTDNIPIPLPRGTPPLAFKASDPALHIEQDKNDITGLTLLCRPRVPPAAVQGVVVSGQTTHEGSKEPITGESKPINITYGRTGPMGYRLALPEPSPEEHTGNDKSEKQLDKKGEPE